MGIEFPESEALRLCEHFFEFSGRAGLTVRGLDVPDEKTAAQFMNAVEKRKDTPLQYILGSWYFDGMELSVGEGVLIPREDTVALVETAHEALKDIKEPKILDLCAGTGAVGLALANRLPNAEVICVELSDAAAKYLDENIEKYGGGRVRRVKADVLLSPPAELCEKRFDMIVSNPPYIPTDDIKTLSDDVKREPFMALDGGGDGLLFYRSICEKYLPLLWSGGHLAVEIGIGQAEDVSRIFVRAGLSDVRVNNDINGKQRVIIGTF